MPLLELKILNNNYLYSLVWSDYRPVVKTLVFHTKYTGSIPVNPKC